MKYKYQFKESNGSRYFSNVKWFTPYLVSIFPSLHDFTGLENYTYLKIWKINYHKKGVVEGEMINYIQCRNNVK